MVGLEPKVELGAWYCGAFSDSPMHWPELAPVQGIPATWGSGEFGTMSGVQALVYMSSDSPLEQAPNDGASDGTVKAATAGAAAIAIAKPPARTTRRAEI